MLPGSLLDGSLRATAFAQLSPAGPTAGSRSDSREQCRSRSRCVRYNDPRVVLVNEFGLRLPQKHRLTLRSEAQYRTRRHENVTNPSLRATSACSKPFLTIFADN